MHCNGKDVFDSMNTMHEAKKHILETGLPVIVQANCVRIHSHSNSDRHDLYRDDLELNYVQQYDPLGKYRRMLLRYNRFAEDELKVIEEKVKEEVKEAHRVVMASPDPSPSSVFDFVSPEPYAASKYPD